MSYIEYIMGENMKKIVIALDGPAGAGKSTISKLVAQKLNLEYIDTGAMYRAVTYKVLKDKVDISNEDKLTDLMQNIQINLCNGRLLLSGNDVTNEIRLPEINEKVSEIAAIPLVRKKLVELQRQMSLNINVIMDGRDIGTNVLTEANYKIFLTATSAERAERRHRELTSKGIEISYDEVLKKIERRDIKDSTRELQPLKKAEDAILIDTTGKTIDQVVNEILKIVNDDKE